jgi:hypothetical protein
MSSSSSSDEVERAVRALMGEVSAMEPPPQTTAKPAKPTKKRKSEGWCVKKDPPADSPTASWSDGWVQYTVKNPANHGNILLKMQVFEGGRPTHSCGVYLDEARDDEICIGLFDLLHRIEDMWVDRHTGVPRTSAVTSSATPLPSWRKAPEGEKRKKAGDCVTTSKKRKA